jgi:hypothetical protein
MSLCADLTRKELEVLAQLATRLSRREIGQRLYVSLNTVKSHQRALYRKLDVEDPNTAIKPGMGTPCNGLSRPAANGQVWPASTISARFASGAGSLSAVADRFGLWDAAGTNNVAWGNFDAYTQYLRVRAPWFRAGLLDVAAWDATLAEIALGAALLRGVSLRGTALASAATLVVLAVSVFFFSGFETPLSASVSASPRRRCFLLSAHRAVTSSASITCAGPGALNRKQ